MTSAFLAGMSEKERKKAYEAKAFFTVTIFLHVPAPAAAPSDSAISGRSTRPLVKALAIREKKSTSSAARNWSRKARPSVDVEGLPNQ